MQQFQSSTSYYQLANTVANTASDADDDSSLRLRE